MLRRRGVTLVRVDPEEKRRLREGALDVKRELLEEAREYSDGNLGWVSLSAFDSDAVLVGADRDLYSGQLGISLFFAAAAACTDDQHARETVSRIVDPWMRFPVSDLRFEHLGAMVGAGSFVYSFTKLYELLGEERYLDRALEVATELSVEDVHEDDRYDVNHGCAGLALALVSLLEHESTEHGRVLARRCGDHLIEAGIHHEAGELAWTTAEDYPTTGFAHGTSGIAYALYALGNLTGISRFENRARDAIRFEGGLTDTDDRRWKKGPSDVGTEHPQGWCWGDPGIGLSRLAALEFDDEDVLREDAESGVEVAREVTMADDCLCHGTYGNVDVLLEAGRRLDTKYLTDALTQATGGLDERKARGHFRFPLSRTASFAHPSLMRGKAGIGYTLLRLAHPETLPSVLLLE